MGLPHETSAAVRDPSGVNQHVRYVSSGPHIGFLRIWSLSLFAFHGAETKRLQTHSFLAKHEGGF